MAFGNGVDRIIQQVTDLFFVVAVFTVTCLHYVDNALCALARAVALNTFRTFRAVLKINPPKPLSEHCTVRRLVIRNESSHRIEAALNIGARRLHRRPTLFRVIDLTANLGGQIVYSVHDVHRARVCQRAERCTDLRIRGKRFRHFRRAATGLRLATGRPRTCHATISLFLRLRKEVFNQPRRSGIKLCVINNAPFRRIE